MATVSTTVADPRLTVATVSTAWGSVARRVPVDTRSRGVDRLDADDPGITRQDAAPGRWSQRDRGRGRSGCVAAGPAATARVCSVGAVEPGSPPRVHAATS